MTPPALTDDETTYTVSLTDLHPEQEAIFPLVRADPESSAQKLQNGPNLTDTSNPTRNIKQLSERPLKNTEQLAPINGLIKGIQTFIQATRIGLITVAHAHAHSPTPTREETQSQHLAINFMEKLRRGCMKYSDLPREPL